MQRLILRLRPKAYMSFHLSPEPRGYADGVLTSSMNLIGELNYLLNSNFHFGSGLVVNARTQITDCII